MKSRSKWLIMVLSIIGFGLNAQTWSTIGSGIGQDVSFRNDAVVSNNELYVGEAVWTMSPAGLEIIVRKWDGQNWSQLPTYNSSAFFEFGDIAIYNGDVYVGLVSAGMGNAKLLKYDGSQWSEVIFPSVNSMWSIRALVVENGELYIGGYFDFTAGTGSCKNIVKYDGQNFTPMPGLSGPNQTVSNIYFHNGVLYAQARQTYTWNGTSFGSGVHIISQYASLSRSFLTSFKNELYCAADTFLYKVSNGTSTLVKIFPFKITDMDIYNGELYIVGDTIRRTWTLGGGLVKYDGQTFTTLTAPTGLHTGEVYNGELHYFSSSVTMYNGVQYDRAFKMVGTIGIEEPGLIATDLKVYPNPASQVFYIENTLNEKQEIKLINATGQIVKGISLDPEMKTEVRTESLSPGMYFIDNGSSAQRIIITP